MRSPQKNNRARGRGNRKSNGNNVNRVYESAGPEGKVRGTPQQIIEKYLSLARDAQTSGDRVVAENFLQHAEHYQRILIQATASQPNAQDRRDNSQHDGDASGMQVEGHNGSDAAQYNGDQPDVIEVPEQPKAEKPAAAPVQEAGQSPAQNSAKSEAPQPASDPAGLTTIEAEPEDGDALLVDEAEMASSQPAKPRRRRAPRKDKPAEKAVQEVAEAQSEG